MVAKIAFLLGSLLFLMIEVDRNDFPGVVCAGLFTVGSVAAAFHKE